MVGDRRLLSRVPGTEAVIVPMVEPLEHPLSPQEVAVVRSLADGLNLGQTGDRLGITRATVKTHLARAFAKTGVHTQAEVVAWAFRAGVIS